MMGTILVTGGAGFLGREVVKMLLDRGQLVRMVVRQGAVIEADVESRLEGLIYTQDLFAEEFDSLLQMCTNVDSILHLAWYVNHNDYLYSDKNMACVTGTLRLGEAAKHACVRRFIGVGTCLEYKFSEHKLTVNDDLLPQTPYAVSKAATFSLLSRYFKDTVDFIWCRVFFLYGEGEDSAKISSYIKNSLKQDKIVEIKNGKQIRDFIEVRVAARQIVDETLSKRSGPVNISTGVGISVKDFAQGIAKELGKEHLLKFNIKANEKSDEDYIVGANINLT